LENTIKIVKKSDEEMMLSDMRCNEHIPRVIRTVVSEDVFETITSGNVQVHILNLPLELQTRLDEVRVIFEEFIRGFYFKHDAVPFLLQGTELTGIDNIEYKINTIEELFTFVSNNNTIVINNDLRISKTNMNLIRKFIYSTPKGNYILKKIVEFLESEYMLLRHVESDIILSDNFNISDDYTIINNISLEYETFIDYFRDNVDIYEEEVLNIIHGIYIDVKKFIFDLLDVETNNTYRFNVRIGNGIELLEYPPPSSLRYMLNILLKE